MCSKTTCVQVHAQRCVARATRNRISQSSALGNLYIYLCIYLFINVGIYKFINAEINQMSYFLIVSFNWVAMTPKAEIFENPGPTHSNLLVIRMSTFHVIAPAPHNLITDQGFPQNPPQPQLWLFCSIPRCPVSSTICPFPQTLRMSFCVGQTRCEVSEHNATSHLNHSGE